MITNGFLLTPEKVNQFEDLKIYNLQITIDGLAETHNKRRPLKNNEPTFNRIVQNISHLFQLTTKVAVQIRVNIDSTNTDEYNLIYSYLTKKFDNKNLMIYPGFVEDNETNIHSSTCNLNNDKQALFLLEQFESYGIYTKLYPTKNYSDCIMRQKNGWLIGPDGALYKCMSHLGDKSKSVGNIEHGITNPDLLTTFLVGADPLIDKKCSNCKSLPECGGGCPDERIKYDNLGLSKRPCSVFKNNMPKFIKSYFKYVKHSE